MLRGELQGRDAGCAELMVETLARYANDKDMNDELRAVERADDPAAAFLTVRPCCALPRSFTDSFLSRRRNAKPRARNGQSILVHRPRRIGSTFLQATDGMESVSRFRNDTFHALTPHPRPLDRVRSQAVPNDEQQET